MEHLRFFYLNLAEADPEFERFETREERDEAVAELLETYRNDAMVDEWPENFAGSLVCGVVTAENVRVGTEDYVDEYTLDSAMDDYQMRLLPKGEDE